MIDGFIPWPEKLASQYVRDGYWRDETVFEWLRSKAVQFPNAKVRDASCSVTLKQLIQASLAIAATLEGSGVGQGDVVLFQLSNRVDSVAVFFALASLGALPILAFPQLPPNDLGLLARKASAKWVVASPENRENTEKLSELEPEFSLLPSTDLLWRTRKEPTQPSYKAQTSASDVAVLLVSGGTMGGPKIAPRTHRDWLYSGRAVAEACGFGPDTYYLAVQPLAHNWTLTHGMLATLEAGGSLYLAASPVPTTAFKVIAEQGITNTGLVPAVLKLWIDAQIRLGADLSSLRTVTVGASKPNTELLDKVEEVLGCNLQQAFGMTEGLCGFHRPGEKHDIILSTQGTPVSPADELRVLDEEGQDVPEGTVGELVTQGPYTIRGYFRDAEANKATFTLDGWYRTGDLVRLIEGRHVIFEGRVKEQVNRGGEKISVHEVEQLVHECPGVSDAALTGIPHTRYGEALVAFVVGRVSEQEVLSYLRQRGLAEYKIPSEVIIVEKLPMTPIGKVSKRILRQMYLRNAD